MTDALAVMVNGEATAQVAASDRGLHYGDGLFETLPIVAGRPVDLDAHLARLCGGCVGLAMQQPDVGQLQREADAMCHGHDRAVLKIIVTRGSGGRGYRPDNSQAPTRILSVHPWPDYPAEFADTGIILRLCRTRLAIQPLLAGMKHLNRLEQVLARSEWDEPGIPEGLMRDTEGRVIEGTQSNVFLVKDGVLVTPDVSRCGVDGITRLRILAIAEADGIDCQIRDVTLDEVIGADELFVCNSLIGIWPVQAFTARHLPEPVRYAPGPLTRRLQTMLQDMP